MADFDLPALARLGTGPLALAGRSPGRDWLTWAEERARRASRGERDDRAASQASFADGRGKPWAQRGAVAVIPVTGLLMKDWPWIGDSWATGYVQLRWQVAEAMADASVAGVALWIDSPGGYVDGLFELTAFLREARDAKPLAAIVDGVAASAGYAIAASATSLAMGRFGLVGSIGVMTVHWDFSKALDAFGIVPTLLFAGKHKVEGNPFQPLPDEVRERWQAELEEFRRVFAEDVAAGRNGAIDAAGALATEAAVYHGPSGSATAKTLGLVDEVASPDDALAAFVDHLTAAGG